MRVLKKVVEALRETGGATEKYAETATWFESFARVLEQVKDFCSNKPDTGYQKDIAEQVSKIDLHYALFESYLERFDPSLNSKSSVNKVKTAAKKVEWCSMS